MTINSGATLAGGGTSSTTLGAILSTVTLNSGASLQPGAAANGLSSVGTLSMAGLTVKGGTLVFQVGTVSDQVLLTGTSGTVLNITAPTLLSLAQSGTSAIASGTYSLFKYAATSVVTGTGNISLSLDNPLKSASFSLSGTSLDLVYGDYLGSFVWSGSQNSVWDVNAHASPKNWTQQDSGLRVDFVNTLKVLFNDAAASGTVTLSGTVSPGSLIFANNTLAYTLGSDGTGVLAGTATLLKSGTGVLTINAGSNTFSGGATLSAGSLALGADSVVVGGTLTKGALGTGTITLAGAQLLDNGTARVLANALSIAADTTFASTGTSGTGSLV
ncbi:MAG: hypothetical protein EBR81_17515, partial [Proteobacteria bacterium]|nr:hypothetical protein [Pseudomonadota bacterium]